MQGRVSLNISEDLCFVHDPSVGSGKTRTMAKGLFFRYKGRLCSGESAGFGLPVLKTGIKTCFPSLAAMSTMGETSIIKEFSMDRFIVWRISNRKAPAWFGFFMEFIVSEYLKRPSLQQRLLMLRDKMFSLFAVHSSMICGKKIGTCRIRYQTVPDGLIISVDAGDLPGKSRLIMLNEVDGRAFNRLRINDLVLRDNEVPAWKEVPRAAALESPLLDVGISISCGMNQDQSLSCVYCGREVASELDWAGLAVLHSRRMFSYRVYIHPLV
ncbi:MAG TPA: hypothetical protein VMU10_07160 [Desulfomonilia bacterium]|nr:hypothetical protein [Desulfomonilia bacterium]